MRFLSWLLMIPCTIANAIVVGISDTLLVYLLTITNGGYFYNRDTILLFGSLAVIALSILPLTYGAKLTKAVSNKVCMSEKGNRYGVYGLLIAIVYFIGYFSKSPYAYYYSYDHQWLVNYSDLIMALHGIALIFQAGKKTKKNNSPKNIANTAEIDVSKEAETPNS